LLSHLVFLSVIFKKFQKCSQTTKKSQIFHPKLFFFLTVIKNSKLFLHIKVHIETFVIYFHSHYYCETRSICHTSSSDNKEIFFNQCSTAQINSCCGLISIRPLHIVITNIKLQSQFSQSLLSQKSSKSCRSIRKEVTQPKYL